MAAGVSDTLRNMGWIVERWAKIVVLEGRLRYRILEPVIREFELWPSRPDVVEPEVPHEVEAIGEVRFYVEFYR